MCIVASAHLKLKVFLGGKKGNNILRMLPWRGSLEVALVLSSEWLLLAFVPCIFFFGGGDSDVAHP